MNIRHTRFKNNNAKHEQAEQNKQENAHHQRLILSALPVAAIVMRPDGSVVYANKYAKDQFGCEANQNIFDFYSSPDEREKVISSIRQQGCLEGYELRTRTTNGNPAWALFSSQPFEFDGEALFLSSMVDITVHKLSEESLQKKKEVLSKAFHSSQTAIAITRFSDGCLLDTNEAFQKLSGYLADELIGKSIIDLGLLVNIEDREQVISGLSSEGKTLGQEYECRKKDNTVAICRMSAELFEIEGEMYVLFDVVDVSEHHKAEATLQQSEEQLRMMFKFHDAVFLLIEPGTGQILTANIAAEKFYGYPLETIKTMRIQDINIMDPGKAVDQHLKSLRESRNCIVLNHRLANGEIRIVEVHSSPIIRHGIPTLFSIIHDITERKRAEEKLALQFNRLKTLHTIERAVISSTDLNTILTLLVQETVKQLQVDTSAVLLMNPQTQTLDFAVKQGFLTDAMEFTKLGLGIGFAGRAAQDRRVVYFPDLTEINYDMGISKAITNEQFVTYVGIPLIAKDNLLGVLEIFHRSKILADPDWLRFLETIANQAAIAIDNARLLEITQQNLKKTSALYQINQKLIATIDSEDLMADVVDLLQKNFGYYYVQIFIVDHKTGNFVVRAGSGELGKQLKSQGFRLSVGEGIVGLTSETGEPFFTNDVEKIISFARHPLLVDTKSELAVPIKVGHQFLGLLDVHQAAPNYLTEQDVQLVSAVANQLAVALQKAKLYADLKEASNQERASRSQLIQAEKLAVTGRLLASVSHELNNPIQAIQNALFLLKEEQGISNQGKQDLGIVLSETERMVSMLKRLRTTYQPVNFEGFKQVQMNDIINDVGDLIAAQLRQSQISFKFHPDPELPSIHGLEDQLRQVILNLFMNAVEAMATDRGDLIITTLFLPQSREVQMTVSDTGPGIEENIMPIIFDAFVTNKKSGTGLGLNISHEIILKHHGRIQANNNPVHGATISIWLPVDARSHE